MKFEIEHRFTGAVVFTAELSASFKTKEFELQLGAAVKMAVKDGANLARANLAGANLARANLAGANLASAYLARANLARANLARANLYGANLAGANLYGANLAGANLDGANLAGAYLARANLARANLAGANLDGANLARANLDGANLDGANLARASLDGANLARANLAGANLDGANLARASLDGANLARALKIKESEIPVIENIDATILAEIEQGGTLDMGSWHGSEDHWCGTTHCRAGWAIHCAGKKGKALEDKVGPRMAGTLIYHASSGRVPWFFDSSEGAMADLRKCAAEQLAKAK